MDDLDAEIVQEFLIESHENLDQLDRDLVALELDPTSRDLLASIFRTIHTIKGTSGFLAYHKLEAITHVGESLLAKLRDGVFTLTPDTVTALLRMVDAVRVLLGSIEHHGVEGDSDVEPLAAELRALVDAEVANAVRGTEPAAPVGAAPVEELTAVLAQSEAELRSTVGDSTVRVDVTLLEQLVRLTGELVLARNQILQRSALVGDEVLGRACHRLNLVTGELQEGVLRTRMQPIDQVWSKFPRVVRDLSAQLGRSVRLDMAGGDTELDRTLLEAVKDPLTHLVRNAIDHGIEPPEVRIAAGKPATGVLRLRAAHEGGQVLIEVSDDGKGLDAALLGRKAVEKGLLTADRVAVMSEQDLLDLVFVAGFSTASVVTNVSGRGVGMDVVRTNIGRIGGSIDVHSTPGGGACWRLRIPLTLAIVPALAVECSGQRFAIPQINLLELVNLDSDRSSGGIESVAGAKVYRLRGALLPLILLDEALGLTHPDGARPVDAVVAVLEADGRRFGLVVDRVLETEEIVVKPLSNALKEIGLYAGATVLGDGAVSLILDVQGLARQQLITNDGNENSRSIEAAPVVGNGTDRRLLVVGLGDGRRVAMPLEVVTRLEQFPVADIHRVGRRDVVHYRGEILPAIRLADHLGGDSSAADANAETVAGVVYSARGRSVALMVHEIIDIVTERSVGQSDVDEYGIVGMALIRDEVTELLDVRAAILAADPMYYDDETGLDEAVTPIAHSPIGAR